MIFLDTRDLSPHPIRIESMFFFEIFLRFFPYLIDVFFWGGFLKWKGGMPNFLFFSLEETDFVRSFRLKMMMLRWKRTSYWSNIFF